MSTLSSARPAGSGIDLTSSRSKARGVRNAAATVMIVACFLLALVPLAWILWTVGSKGFHLLLSLNWWEQSQLGMTSRTAGGGAYHAIMGSLIIALGSAVVSVPVGVFGAIYLVEYGGRGPIARAVSFMVDILTGIPSIVAALFVYALWVTLFGFGRTGFAVSLSLVLLMVPTVLRLTEEVLRLVPNELREASAALGVPRWKTILKVVVPTAFSGIVTGVVLGLARIMGETAPLLILGPYTAAINFNPFAGNMAALPTMINQDRTESLQPAVDRTWAAALTLVLLVLVLNLLARAVARFSAVRNR